MSRLRRFLRIERPRSERPDDVDPSPETAERFGAVERPGPMPGAPRSSGAAVGRFGPDPEPRIELLETGAGERPFTRCMRCGMDHNVFATECAGCGASLDTEPQREFNERLWTQRQEEAAREAHAEAERRALAARAEAELAASRRAMGEELAREVGRRERRRLGLDGGLGGGSGGLDDGDGAPLGWKLLRAIPDWRWQVGALVAAVAVVGGLVAFGRAGHPVALFAGMLLVVVLAVPRWKIHRWWW
jgi:ribosomal protein L37E